MSLLHTSPRRILHDVAVNVNVVLTRSFKFLPQSSGLKTSDCPSPMCKNFLRNCNFYYANNLALEVRWYIRRATLRSDLIYIRVHTAVTRSTD